MNFDDILPLVKFVHPIWFCDCVAACTDLFSTGGASYCGFCVHRRMCPCRAVNKLGSVLFSSLSHSSWNFSLRNVVALISGHQSTWSCHSHPLQHGQIVVSWSLYLLTILAIGSHPCTYFLTEFWCLWNLFIALWNASQAISLNVATVHWYFFCVHLINS